MLNDTSEAIRITMSQETTEELLNLWQAHDRDLYTEEAFQVIRSILEERGVAIPTQVKKTENVDGAKRAVGYASSVPGKILGLAYGAIFWMGGGNILLGFLGVAGKFDAYKGSLGWAGIIIGAVYIGLGLTVSRRRSASALWLSIVLTGAILLRSIYQAIQIVSSGDVPLGLGGIPLGIVFMVWMIRGLAAIPRLEERGNR